MLQGTRETQCQFNVRRTVQPQAVVKQKNKPLVLSLWIVRFISLLEETAMEEWCGTSIELYKLQIRQIR